MKMSKCTTKESVTNISPAFFAKEESLCYCCDISGLFNAIIIACEPSEWRQYIDSSSRSPKAVLLHNGNKYSSLPVAHSLHHTEDYNSVQYLLEVLKYDGYRWEVNGDFKIVAFLMGLQGGFTKITCYLCLWDSKDRAAHYQRKEWPARSEFSVGSHNIKHEPLVDPNKILLPPLHIKLGLMKQCVTTLDKESAAFKYSKAVSCQRQKLKLVFSLDLRSKTSYSAQSSPPQKKKKTSTKDKEAR